MVPKVILALPLLLTLSGCITLSTTGGTLCSVGPFITDPGATERLTRSEKEYQVTLNEAGKQICGWAPPGQTR